MIESLEYFLSLLDDYELDLDSLNDEIRTNMNVYMAVKSEDDDETFFTGYYIPTLRGSLVETTRYKYPIYSKPNSSIKHYTRKEIEEGALKGKGLELVYVDNKIDLFFLHIQGSGIIQLDDGSDIYVGYGGVNGMPYRSIGALLLKEQKINKEDMSMQTIKQYLYDHPEDIDRVLSHNPSYVFFTKTKQIGIGSIGAALVDGRAIATDKNIYPRGVLSYIETMKPELDENGQISQWVPFSRFVLNQDTGGAIKGPARADIFWGKGQYGEIAAGYMKHKGKLYFLIKKIN
ncbi:MltA domain-containing protein [Candidatus Magnetoovum chiemensis]|nr:MltA domain-containing protein [Candidatus Magnetoovum chiemensis]